jgi:hypothetical protein
MAHVDCHLIHACEISPDSEDVDDEPEGGGESRERGGQQDAEDRPGREGAYTAPLDKPRTYLSEASVSQLAHATDSGRWVQIERGVDLF